VNGKAIVFVEPNRAELRTVAVPERWDGEMLVRTECTGVSQGTETWAFTGRRPETEWPTIPGYQGVGVVEDGPLAGKRVVFHKGRYPAGMPESWMGAHQEWALVEHATVVPDGLDPLEVAHFAVVGVALRGLKRSAIGPGDTAVVLGLGLVGQLCAQVLRSRGVHVVGTDYSELRRRIAGEHSVDAVFAPDDEQFRETLACRVPDGVDMVLDTTGRVDLSPLWIELIRAEGEIVLQGWYPDPLVIDFHEAHHKLANIRMPCSWEPDDVSLQWIASSKVDSRSLITDRVAPASCGEMYTRMASGDPNLLGVVFDWR